MLTFLFVAEDFSVQRARAMGIKISSGPTTVVVRVNCFAGHRKSSGWVQMFEALGSKTLTATAGSLSDLTWSVRQARCLPNIVC